MAKINFIVELTNGDVHEHKVPNPDCIEAGEIGILIKEPLNKKQAILYWYPIAQIRRTITHVDETES